jgi:hypothetical protein
VLQPARFAFPAHAKFRGIYRANCGGLFHDPGQDARELTRLAFGKLELNVLDVRALAEKRKEKERLYGRAPPVFAVEMELLRISSSRRIRLIVNEWQRRTNDP